MKKKLALYTRVSTNKEEQRKSLENQEEIYTDYAERHGYELVLPIYAEAGKSGTNSRRPQFKQLLFDGGVDFQENARGNDIFNESDREPKFDVIICKDVSRWSRSSNDGKQAVERLLAKGVHVIFENSGVSTMDKDWEMRVSLLFAFAQNESHNLGQRIKFSRKNNAKKGIYKPARLPYGYVRNELKEIGIHKEQSQIVQAIFERYKEVGSGIISRELNEKGVLTQLGHKWTPDKITRIISNSIYTGLAVSNKSVKNNVTDTKRTKVAKTEHISIPNAVDPIISDDVFAEAQKIMASRTDMFNKKKRGRKPARNDKYERKLKCENCGSRFVRHIGNGDKITYICQNRRKGLGCRVRGIAITTLDSFMNQTHPHLLANTMGDSIHYKILLDSLENQKKSLSSIKQELSGQILMIEDEVKATFQMMKKKLLADEDKMIVDMLKEDINESNIKAERLKADLKKLNLDAIAKLQSKVKTKKKLIETIFSKKKMTEEDKFQLLNVVEIGDYELEFKFSIPSYEEEILEFNELFFMNPIHSDTPFRPFTDTFRRDHKGALEYWEEIDQHSMESDTYFYNPIS